MTDEQAARIEQKLDTLLAMKPTIDALGSLVVRRSTATDRMGLNKNTISGNQKITKFEIQGSNATLLKLEDISVIRQRKRRQ